jgi:hypothetical protein
MLFARDIFFGLGFAATASLINTDIQKYKAFKGIIRWKHRIENVGDINRDGIRTFSWS